MIDVWPVQVAIYSALTAAPATYPVHDAVPQSTAYPYITIGEWTGQSDEELAAPSTDAEITLNAWSRQSGKAQTFAMLEFIRDRLDGQALGGGAWACTEEFADVVEDPSSTASARLYHGIATYRVRVT